MQAIFYLRSKATLIYVPLTTALLVLGMSLVLVSLVRNDGGHSSGMTASESIEIPASDCACMSTLLVLGNSQTFSIPNSMPGDLATPQWLQKLLARRSPNSVDVELGSLGGMTAEEMMARVIQWKATLNRAGQLLIAIQPSEFSQIALRPDLERALKGTRSQQILAELIEQNSDLPIAKQELTRLAQPTTLIQVSRAEILEDRLQKEAANALPLFGHQEDLVVTANLLFTRERNRIFGIRTLGRKPFKPRDYRAGIEFLTVTLRYARDNDIPVYIYLAPVRPEAESIYSDSDVSALASDVRALAIQYSARFADYRRAVPDRYWTTYPDTPHNRIENIAGQPDPAHFLEAAHKDLAEKIDQTWGELMIGHANAVAGDLRSSTKLATNN